MSSSYELVYNFTKLVQKNSEIDKILTNASSLALDLAEASHVSIALYDNITHELYCRSSSYQGDDDIKNEFFRYEIGKGFIGWVAKNKRPVRIRNATKDKRYNPEIDNRYSQEISSVLALPMVFLGKLKGVMQLINKKTGDAFSKTDMYKLTILATQLAAAIENHRLTEENLNQSLLSHIGQNIANSAHGIKNILNNIDGGTFIVERGVSARQMGMVDKGWDIMKRNSFRLRELVLDMLLFSRPKKPEYLASDINKTCCDVYQLIKEKADQLKVEIILDLDPAIGQVFIDPKGMYRSILNLVSNAIYSFQNKENRVVRIETRLVGEKNFKIVISDNGAGISKENLNHIFDVFFTTKGSKGTGLGLPVTKKIISEHHGFIDVSSKLKEGTVFTITMPRNRS